MNQPLVSVIIPVYNGEKYLSETLHTIVSQTYPQLEVIVVDDGSVDGSARIAQSFQNIRYFYQENRGVPVARNQGIEKSNGLFIAFSDQDDLWKPDKIEKQVRFLLDNQDILYVIAKRKLFLEQGMKRPSWLKKELLYEESVDYSPGSVLMHTSVFEKVGIFNPTFENASDVDWFFRANNFNIPKGIIPEVLYLKRIHQHNQSNRVDLLHGEYLKLIRESIHIRKHPL